MKKVLFALASVAFLALGMTACQKDETVIKFKATIERGNSKTSLNAVNDDNEHPITWEAGDEIMVWGVQGIGYHCVTRAGGASTAEFEVAHQNTGISNSSSFKAGYPAEYWTTGAGSHLVSLPVQRVYREDNMYKFPMYAESNTTDLNFKNVCGVLKIVLPSFANTSLIGIDVYANSAIAGDFIVTMRDGVPHVENGTESEIEMQFDEPISLNGGKSFYIYLPPSDDLTTTDAGGFNDFEMVFYTSDGHYGVAKANGPIRIERSKITTVTLNGISFDEEVETSANYFSVSPSLKVDISTGNLQYANSEWRFAPHQYDFIGARTGNVIDMFARSSDQNHYGLNVYNENSISSIAGAFQDWGNLMYSNRSTAWRTLSHSEWNYLLYYRHRNNNEEDVLFKIVSISDLTYTEAGVVPFVAEEEDFTWDDHISQLNITGFILLPDESTADWNTLGENPNQPTKTELATFLNANNAVFIPLVYGYMFGQILQSSPQGIYWNSDLQEGSDGDDDPIWGQSANSIIYYPYEREYHQWFSVENPFEDDPNMFSYYSVRLVRNAMHKSANNEWDYYPGFDPNQSNGSAKGKRRK